MHRRLLFMGMLTALLWAQDLEKFRELPGVKLGKVDYRRSETKRDRKLEILLTSVEEIPTGQEVTYSYSRLSLDGKHRHYLVFLSGSFFSGSGGGTGLILEEVDSAPLGFEYRGTLSLVNPPLLVSPKRHEGWNDLIWLTAGGGAKPAYSGVQYRKGYREEDLKPLPAGSKLEGTAYFADFTAPQNALRFVAGQP